MRAMAGPPDCKLTSGNVKAGPSSCSRPLPIAKPTDEPTIKVTALVGSPLDQGKKVKPPRDQCSKLFDVLGMPQRQRKLLQTEEIKK